MRQVFLIESNPAVSSSILSLISNCVITWSLKVVKYHSLSGRKVMRKARNGFQCHSHVSRSGDDAVATNATNLIGSAATSGVEGAGDIACVLTTACPIAAWGTG